MNNGKSRLIPSLDANVLSAILFFLAVASCLFNGFWGWLSPITFVLTLVLFFFDSNSFVRKCSVQMLFFYLITIASSLVFGMLLGIIPVVGLVFRVIDWVIRSIVCIMALISGIQALGGNRYQVPFFSKYIDTACSKLGVF